MRGSNIATIYVKEVRDLLRDRRTLISTIVIPTLIMPLITLGFGKVAAMVVSKARQEVPEVMVIGGADSPGVRSELAKSGKLKVRDATPDWRALISDKRIRAAVEIPAGFDGALKRGAAPAVVIYNYEGEMKSGLAVDQLDGFFTKLRDRTTARLLEERGLPASVARPFEVRRENVAAPERVGGNLFGGIVPYFIIFLCLSGAMYPAMDLTAGEKERGTMETLLCSPATRTEIVLGKFLTVLTGSLASVVLSLISMAATAGLVGSAMGPMAATHGMPAISIDPLGILGVLVMVLPVAVLFSAVIFAVCLFAKSFKEAQSYLTPIMILVILPAIAGILPGVELNLRLAMVPLLNISLVSKEMLSGVWHWGYIAVIFGSTVAYAAAALSAAVWMFRREDVIFRA
jgi:sodium transport system permease protein